ncbi:hypothetical protein MXB02_13355 [Pseudomonas mosselii]|uniref:hypothetical protein n=1 Tax=Pseudomonas mosselii TaxID=78327 RepID=UPI001FFB2D5A|nr:hypothetical protein [Pseudomonas mosselii]UPF06556.1 hypothetical protein MXB02_13355 [Pseudomonas mosselii]
MNIAKAIFKRINQQRIEGYIKSPSRITGGFMDVGCKTDREFVSLFRRFYNDHPSNASVELLKGLALEFWYGDLDIEKLINRELSSGRLTSLQARRAMYLVDRMVSFPCLSRNKAKLLRDIVKLQGAILKSTPPSKAAEQLFKEYKLDKKAFEWGLQGDITIQMKSLLEYQTRHFAAATGKKTGYSE